MTNAHSTTSKTDEASPSREGVLLPLIPVAPRELTATNSVQYELKAIPGDANSSKYKVTARIIDGTEDIRTMIGWSRDVDKVLTGLNLNTDAHVAQAITICSSMMSGTVSGYFTRKIKQLKELRMDRRAQDAYDANTGDAAAKEAAKQAILGQGWEHADNNQFTMIRLSLNACLTAMMPRKVLARCKRHLRRHCRKPKGMRIREYQQLINSMNREEFTRLPPFGPNQYLQDDEILDIILFGTPKSWEREMDKQGFDPFAHRLSQVIDKLEDIETAEGFDADAIKVTPKKDNKKKNNPSKNSNKKSNNNNGGKKHCLFHGWGSHTTEECEHLKKQVKKLKADEAEKKDHNSFSKKSGDWKKKATAAMGEDNFVTFMNQTVQKAVAQAVKSNKSNKRKSDDESDGSLAAFETMDISDFDCDKMERMVIEDNGDITV